MIVLKAKICDNHLFIKTCLRISPLVYSPCVLLYYPAYPASVLGSTVRSYIISLLRFCPSLILENLHRDCIDCLSGEVKGGRPSYGTRIVIQLLRESRPEVCSAASERVRY